MTNPTTPKTPKAAKTPKDPNAPKPPKKCARDAHDWNSPGDGTPGLACRKCPVTRSLEDVTAAEQKILSQSEVAPQRTRAQDHLALKRKVRIFYDLQRLRLQTAGRGASKPKTEEDEVELDETAKAAAADARPTIALHPADLAVLERRAAELERAEKNALADIAEHLATIGFYRDVLSDKTRYRGIGPTMAGVILAEFDIFRLETPSQMWAFAGLRPVDAQRCTQCHFVLDEHGQHTSKKTACKGEPPPGVYASGKAQKPTRGQKLPYNAFLRAKLCGVLGAVLLKLNPSQPLTGTVSPWRKCYDDYKHRKLSDGWGVNDAHRHAAAIRYMIKMLLADIWTKWRAYEKLAVRPSYQEEKLGHTHSGTGSFRDRIVQPQAAEPMSDEVRAELESAGELH